MDRVWIRRGTWWEAFSHDAPGRDARARVSHLRHVLEEERAGRIEVWVATTPSMVVGRLLVAWQAGDSRLADGSRRAHLQDLEVLPAYRGEGVGGALVRRVLARIRDRGFLVATIAVEEGDEEAARLFWRWGFAKTDDRIGACSRLFLRRLESRPSQGPASPTLTARPVPGAYYPVFFGLVTLIGGCAAFAAGEWLIGSLSLAFAMAMAFLLWESWRRTYTLDDRHLAITGLVSPGPISLERVRHVAYFGRGKSLLSLLLDDSEGLVRTLLLPEELLDWAGPIALRAAKAQGVPVRDLTLGSRLGLPAGAPE